MRTVICQSFRTRDVPQWIEVCLTSVRGWAEQRGYDYEFLDDAFLGLVPDWYRDRTRGNMYLISDLARLIFARDMLARGYDRAVWVDADVLIFDPAAFDISVREEYAFAREIFLYAQFGDGERVENRGTWDVQVLPRVNNSVAVFMRGNSFLPFYIHACLSVVRQLSPELPYLPRMAIGTDFLTGLSNLLAFPLVDGAGLISPVVLRELAERPGRLVALLSHLHGRPLYAANLCASLAEHLGSEVPPERVYESGIEKLLVTRGDVINRVLHATSDWPAAAARGGGELSYSWAEQTSSLNPHNQQQ